MWHFLNDKCENSHCSPEQVEEYLAGNCSGGDASALLKLIPTPAASCSQGKPTDALNRSPFGMTLRLDNFKRRAIVWTWLIKNTFMAQSVIALSAGRRSGRETGVASSNAAQMRVAVRFRLGKRPALAQSVDSSSSHRGQDMKHVRGNAERRFACLAGRLIHWSKSGGVLPSSVVLLSQGVCGIKPTERNCFLGIRLRSYGSILRRISSRVCRGITTEKEVANGA